MLFFIFSQYVVYKGNTFLLMNTLADCNYASLNRFFDRIYVLTIERATERHQKLTHDLNGLNYMLFFGVDKNNLSLSFLEKNNIYDNQKAIGLQRYKRPMRLGEIACSMGHKAIYEDVVANNFQKVLILEDDVVPNFENNIETILNELPTNWELVYFDYFKNTNTNLKTQLKQVVYHIQKSLGFLNWSHKTINNLFAKPYSKHLKIAGYHDYASAYAITLNTAKKLIEIQTPICFPADHVLPFAITNEIISGFITIPKIFIQQSQVNKKVVGSYVEQ